jgi:SSS family solute:Na+ symporter
VLKSKLVEVAQNPAAAGMIDKAGRTFPPDSWTGAWKPLLAGPASNPMGVDWFAMVFGLGFVLSFGYWCTNFLVVQRAMAARNMSAARRTPLIAAVPKMLFPVLVILPGMIAAALAITAKDGYRLPPKPLTTAIYSKMVPAVKQAAGRGLQGAAALQAVQDAIGVNDAKAYKLDEGKIAALVADMEASPLSDDVLGERLQGAVSETDYDGVVLSLVKRYCPTGLLGLALTALLASFMSGMAGNVTAFNTIWTYDLYQAYVAPNKSDQHYFWMGQTATVAGILLSIACAYVVNHWSNAMDVIQLVFGFVNAPLFATFLLGMFWARATGTGAFLGLLGGTATSALFHSLTTGIGNPLGIKGGYLWVLLGRTRDTVPGLVEFRSDMAQNFWLATFAFTACFALTVIFSLATKRTKTDDELKGLVYSLTPKLKDEEKAWYMRPAIIGVVLLVGCIILNIIFW